MSSLEDFKDITRCNEPLAPFTWMKVGGPAQYLIQPRNPDELICVIQCCQENSIPVRVLGGGSNLVVHDDGVSGVVIRIAGDGFSTIEFDGNRVRAGAGVSLAHLISQCVHQGLGGLEVCAGIPGTLGGALHGNAGGRNGDIGQFVSAVHVVTAQGERFTRTEDELSFAYRFSSINELAILDCEFELQTADQELITQRMRQFWIMKKATQPLSFQSAGCIFKNPRGLSAGALIEQAGLKGTRIGGAEISDRHANFIVTEPESTADDVLRLIDLSRSKVAEQFGVDLEVEIEIW
jgi:UDP-N-acetylmuramate dehydrogenase